MERKVLSIKNLDIKEKSAGQHGTVITATGIVTSNGWSGGRLIPWLYSEKPSSGIVDFDFIADSPESGYNWAFEEIISAPYIINIEYWIKGIRVHSSTEPKVVSLDPSQKEGIQVNSQSNSDDDPAPFPWFPPP